MTPLEYLLHLYLPFSLPLSILGVACICRGIRLCFKKQYMTGLFEFSIFIGLSLFLMSLSAFVDIMNFYSFFAALGMFLVVNALITVTLIKLNRLSKEEKLQHAETSAQ